MSENWDEHAKTWDRDEPVRFYADQAFAFLIEQVNVRDNQWKSKRILDFGCGTGLLSEKLAPLAREVIAVDTSPNMIDVLRKKEIGNVTAICSDIIDDGAHRSETWFSNFDLIVASSVCSFLPNYELAVEVLSRALNPAGYFVQWDWLSAGEDGFGLTVDRVSNAFNGAGLKCIHLDRAFAVTFGDEEMAVLMGVASAE